MQRVIHLLNGLLTGGVAMLASNVSVAATAPATASDRPANAYFVSSLANDRQRDMTSGNTVTDIGQAIGEIQSLLPAMPPLSDVAVLPKVTKVQPTGEKPLYVLTFKCPTEVIGITPPPTKLLHNLVSSGMDAVNSAGVLPFNMQQVCQ